MATPAARKNIPTNKYTEACIISGVVPSSNNAGLYTKLYAITKATIDHRSANHQVFYGFAPAILATVKEARHTGGVTLLSLSKYKLPL